MFWPQAKDCTLKKYHVNQRRWLALVGTYNKKIWQGVLALKLIVSKPVWFICLKNLLWTVSLAQYKYTNGMGVVVVSASDSGKNEKKMQVDFRLL